MTHEQKRALIEIYQRYGFKLAKEFQKEKTLVFTIKTGYFDNADIVPLVQDADTKSAFDEFSKIGFACTQRDVLSASDAEKQLFKGFFAVDSTSERLKSDYERFTKSIVLPYADDAVYQYINAPYDINGKAGEKTVPEEVITRLDSPRPTLFLIEAAAGFGKTCSAYELVNTLIENTNFLPLFSELSRNRQATIFKYILNDEIDRTFPHLNTRLVQTEISNGKVITILDGFDELLRKNDESGTFENREPMLETISDYLKSKAKIILTTRRTVLFDGDEFHKWIETHLEDFDLVRIKISEPRVSDWLSETRLKGLQDVGIKIENIANPVLLSFLRCIPDEKFESSIREPEYLVEKYFDFMLERERIRQDLRMEAGSQKDIMKSIAEDMISFGYTSEQRDYIVNHILRIHNKLLEEVQKSYAISEKPSKEELANKLASHALLDRSTRDPDKISFINEFVFGHFVAEVICGDSTWLNDDLRFIEPAILAYQPRSEKAKHALWLNLKGSIDFLKISDKIKANIQLRAKMDFELENDEAENLTIENIQVGENKIGGFQFNSCIFKNCVFNLANFHDVNFLDCRFYQNTFFGDIRGGQIFVLGGAGDDEFISQLKSPANESPVVCTDQLQAIDQFLLEKFWPVGKETALHKHRPIKGLCQRSSEFTPEDLYRGVASLKKRGLLLEPKSPAFVELNYVEINEIRRILGRD